MTAEHVGGVLEAAPASLGVEMQSARLGNQPFRGTATVELPDKVVLETRFEVKVRACRYGEGVNGTCPEPAFTFGLRVRCNRVTSGRSDQGHTARSAPHRRATRLRRRGSAPQGLAASGHAK